jgi:hypothetical protein
MQTAITGRATAFGATTIVSEIRQQPPMDRAA